MPLQAVAFARAYGASPLAALMAAGYLTADDLGADQARIVVSQDVADISTRQLLDELQHRLTQLRDSFDNLERNNDRAALETLVAALTARHLPAENVVRLADHRDDHLSKDEATKLLDGERYAADERDGRDEEAEANTTP